jgi:hypothetical protein
MTVDLNIFKLTGALLDFLLQEDVTLNVSHIFPITDGTLVMKGTKTDSQYKNTLSLKIINKALKNKIIELLIGVLSLLIFPVNLLS